MLHRRAKIVCFFKHSLPLDSGWVLGIPLGGIPHFHADLFFILPYFILRAVLLKLFPPLLCLWNTVDLETDAGERFTEAEVLVRSCVTKSCRKMTSAVQLAARKLQSVMRISCACPVSCFCLCECVWEYASTHLVVTVFICLLYYIAYIRTKSRFWLLFFTLDNRRTQLFQHKLNFSAHSFGVG